MEELLPEDAGGSELARNGPGGGVLSEHTLVGMMEGYLLTGRHGFFHTYEAFAHVIASMFNPARQMAGILHPPRHPGAHRSVPGTA